MNTYDELQHRIPPLIAWNADRTEGWAHPYDSVEVGNCLAEVGLTPAPGPTEPFTVTGRGLYVECYADPVLCGDDDGVEGIPTDVYRRTFHVILGAPQ